MPEFTIDNGVKSYTINGCEVRFNPTDMFFMERLFSVFISLEDKKDEYEKEKARVTAIGGTAGLKELFATSRRYDKEMREMLDGVVGGPISQAVAGEVNIYAADSEDKPIYVAILFYLIDQMDVGVSAMAKNANPRIEAYLKKYSKKYHIE